MGKQRIHLDCDRIVAAITKHHGNLTEAALELGCSQPTLRRRIYASPEMLKVYKDQFRIHDSPQGRQTNILQHILADDLYEIQKAAEHIFNLLSLCQVRCKNAASLRRAGDCHARYDPKDEDHCFTARLHEADARLASEDLLKKVQGLLRKYGDSDREPNTGDDDDH